jgi:hypothetical protein
MTLAHKQYIFVGALVLLLTLFGASGTAAVEAYAKKIKGVFPEELDNEQIDSILLLASMFNEFGDGDLNKLHYIIATAYHESKLRSIKEYRCASHQACYALQNAYWYTGYMGRGYVQLTWQANYQKMEDVFGWPLVSDPDVALEADKAAAITVYGMMEGSFTGKKLNQYINGSEVDFYNARRVVNSTNMATLIAGYAEDISNAYNS